MPGRKAEDRVSVLDPKPGMKPVRISSQRYCDLKGAILRALGGSGQGIACADLADAGADGLNAPLWKYASLGWCVTSPKLELEARGLLHHGSRRGRQQVHLGPGPL